MKKSSVAFLYAFVLYIVFSLVKFDKALLGLNISWDDFYLFGILYVFILFLIALEKYVNKSTSKKYRDKEKSIHVKFITFIIPIFFLIDLYFFEYRAIITEIQVITLLVYAIIYIPKFFDKIIDFIPFLNNIRKKKKDKKVKRKKNALQGWLEALLFALVVVMPIKNYTFQNFKIPSSSMEKTLLIGDYLIANKWKYFFADPQPGDIVTFKNPADPTYAQPPEKYARLIGPVFWDKQDWGLKWQEKKNVVKRVIGMPGDTLEIKNKYVYINGKKLEEDYAQYLDRSKFFGKDEIVWDYDLRKFQGSDVKFGQNQGVMGNRDNFGPVVVPAGAYFVMGDNRDMSLDSRYWGFLDREFITGSPSLIVFSHGEKPVNSMREYLIKEQNNLHNEDVIRWGRTFKLIH